MHGILITMFVKNLQTNKHKIEFMNLNQITFLFAEYDYRDLFFLKDR